MTTVSVFGVQKPGFRDRDWSFGADAFVISKTVRGFLITNVALSLFSFHFGCQAGYDIT